MTIEQAIIQLEYRKDFATPDQIKALDMAISALSTEGAELIDRRQIKWYGCDHEGHIKGINCETADCSKCFFATVEHDEVMSLPVYPFPNSAKSEFEKVMDDIHANKGKEVVIVPGSAENKGEWIVVVDSYFKDGTIEERHWECSKCGSGRSGWGEFKFCPDCGADMRKSKRKPKGEKEPE